MEYTRQSTVEVELVEVDEPQPCTSKSFLKSKSTGSSGSGSSSSSETGCGGEGQPAVSMSTYEAKSNKISTNDNSSLDFCWVCYLPTPILRCTTCPRMYHGECPFNMPGYPKGSYKEIIVDGKVKMVMDICPECDIANNSNITNLKDNPELLKEVCLRVIQVLKTDVLKGENPFISLEEKKDPLYVGFVKKVMDLEILEAAVNRGEIQGPEGFLGEFKWLLHNTMILNGIRLAEAYTVPIVEDVRQLIYRLKLEMCEASACPKWYLVMKDKDAKESVKFKEFIAPCYPPHLLVWTKVDGFPWWPAKIRYPCGKDEYSVSYFRDFRPGKVHAKNIRIMSPEPPTPYKGSGKIKPKLQDAMRDLEKHIEALKNEYGVVKLAEHDTPMPKIIKLDKEFLKSVMFPNLQ